LAQKAYAVSAIRIRFEVGDNGIGFERRLKKRNGIGLSSMASRAQQIGGQLTVRTRSGRGTKVILKVPLAVTTQPACLA
jgi:signal transduction histidine kinase